MTLLWPDGTTTRPTVRSDFDPERLHPVDKVVKPHNGVDLVGFTTIKSPVAGEVITARMNGSAGLTVDVREDGTGHVFRHFHLKSIAVRVGDEVAAGQALGVMGATGKVTGVHLHFEVRVSGVAKNPTTYYADRYRVGAEHEGDDMSLAADIATVHNTVINGFKRVYADIATVHNTVIAQGKEIAALRAEVAKIRPDIATVHDSVLKGKGK